MNPWEQPRTSDVLDQLLADDDNVESILGMIPSLFGISEKATYLAYRALGFAANQALLIMDVEEETLALWRNETPELLQFEAKQLPRLQTEVSAELIRLGFMKNMAMFVAKDAQMIKKSLMDFEFLSKREFDYLLKIRTHYTPGDLLSLEKALNPTQHQDNVVINLSWGQHQAVIEGVNTPYQLIEGVSNEESTGVSDQGHQEPD